MQKLSKLFSVIKRQPKWRLVLAGLVLIGGAVLLVMTGGGKAASKTPVFSARRGPLEI